MSAAAFRCLRILPEADRCVQPRALPAPSSSYSRAMIELLSRLWLALERILGELSGGDAPSASSSAEDQLLVFRLEVLVLLDACDSTRWQSLLSPQQRLGLRATLQSLLWTLAALQDSPDAEIIGHAQNHLFDSLLRHHIEGDSNSM